MSDWFHQKEKASASADAFFRLGKRRKERPGSAGCAEVLQNPIHILRQAISTEG